ncbi:MAG: NUDIX domain-containing protein [Clostridia bacterium]|nr:NUDIX domain-containing protein [Clostridia bacterium]
MDELFDTYTREGEYLGVKTKKECHSKEATFYHKPAWTWIYNSKGEFLIQKRAKCKKNFPNCWDMPCAGHIDAGESIIQGVIREAKEEIGIDITEQDCEFKFEYIMDWAKEIGQVYFIKCDKDISEFTIAENEVAQIKWVSFDEIRKLIYSDEWVPMDIEYKDKVINEFKELLNK